MIIWLKILSCKFKGDWFKVAYKQTGEHYDYWDSCLIIDYVYGVYHPTRRHDWDYPFKSHADAQRKCDELNKEILNEKKS